MKELTFARLLSSKIREASGPGNCSVPLHTARHLAIICAVGKITGGSRRVDGGPGSGNWGHEGVPGQVGGSAPGGGAHNRMNAEGGGYTSFSKIQKALAKEHVPTRKEIDYARKPGTVIKMEDDNFKYNPDDGLFHGFSKSGDEFGVYTSEELGEAFQDTQMSAKILLANESSPNFTKVKGAKIPSVDEARSRFEKAFRAKKAKDADDMLRDNAETAWNTASSDEKRAIWEYTGSAYYSINGVLRGSKKADEDAAKRIDHITNMIDRSELPEDMVFFRGVSKNSFEKTFGLSKGELATTDLTSLIGRKGTDKGFASSSSSEENDAANAVNYEIYAPKGTKAVYAEPFSAFGLGNGLHWDARIDGKSKQEGFSSEDETLFQRGTDLMILDGDKNGASYTFKVMIIGQQPRSYT